MIAVELQGQNRQHAEMHHLKIQAKTLQDLGKQICLRTVGIYLLSSAMLNAALAMVRSLSASSSTASTVRESVLLRPEMLFLSLIGVLVPEADSSALSISESCSSRRRANTTNREVRRRISDACCSRSKRETCARSVWYGVRILVRNLRYVQNGGGHLERVILTFPATRLVRIERHARYPASPPAL